MGWRDCVAEGRLFDFILVLFGVWLTATDSLITATILPDVGADLGGYAYFGWAIAGFMLGVVVASASAGRISEHYGLRIAMVAAGLVFAFGCAMAALAPDISIFLVGRLVQGIGGGWISGLAMVVIGIVFPRRHIARVFAATAAVWGIATILGPLIGGLFADWGEWRMVFWLYTAQAAIFALAALRLPAKIDPDADLSGGFPWRQMVLLAIAVGLIGVAGLLDEVTISISLTFIGLAGIAGLVRYDRTQTTTLLPRSGGDLRTVTGAGYTALFALTAASAGLNAYGPAILQQLQGLSALTAGYAVATMAVTWTLSAFYVAGVTERAEPLWIRSGAGLILLGALGLALTMPNGTLLSIVFATGVLGLGFGLSSSLMNRRVMGALPEAETAIGSSALIAVRQTGGAVGAAIAATAANLSGFNEGISDPIARTAGFWVFAASAVPALIGFLAAWQMTRSAARDEGG
ncbi:hypothetical protein MB02_11620 [Croceicoccus estronivorus]|uniref:MFS transporter n=1 Tax=Croceicoccus estronivorus TaxID=1172626 RepID=UPI00083659AC|nr:MFS transporter [Croceicoccus estronivorus]OCC23454.1 hypothetical protein MB02_11620 [Croceicoccus estronivorus]